jgi:signal transduction histidine kinase
LDRTADGLVSVVEDLQEISRGLHPAILSRGGLVAALKTLARRSPVPVELDLEVQRRLPEPVEVAAYYVVSEALANAAKHAEASVVWVNARVDDALLSLTVHDDGVGSADASRGSGLTGLSDRVQALGGTIEIESPPGSGTTIRVRLPIARSSAIAAH